MENLRKEALWIAMSFPARHLNSHAVDPLQPTFKLQRPFLRFQRYGPIAHFNASLKVLTRLPGTGLQIRLSLISALRSLVRLSLRLGPHCFPRQGGSAALLRPVTDREKTKGKIV
jgi:hypothetical protein